MCKVHCLSSISSPQFAVNLLCSPRKSSQSLLVCVQDPLQGYITNLLQYLCRALEFCNIVEALDTTSFRMRLILQDIDNK